MALGLTSAKASGPPATVPVPVLMTVLASALASAKQSSGSRSVCRSALVVSLFCRRSERASVRPE
jgi:hypothetical protein